MIKVTVPNNPGFAQTFQSGMALGSNMVPSAQQRAQTNLLQQQASMQPMRQQQAQQQLELQRAQIAAEQQKQQLLQQQAQQQAQKYNLMNSLMGGTSPASQQSNNNQFLSSLPQQQQPNYDMGLSSLGANVSRETSNPLGNELSQQIPQESGGDLASLFSQPREAGKFGIMTDKTPEQQAMLSKLIGLPTSSEFVKNMSPVDRNVFLSNADDRTLAALGANTDEEANNMRKANAIAYENSNLSTGDKDILSATRNYVTVMNEDAVPLVNKMQKLIMGSGIKGGIQNLSSKGVAKIFGSNNELYKTKVSLMNVLKDLSSSFRRSTGERGAMPQIALNIDMLTKELQNNKLPAFIDNFNHLSKAAYDKGNNIINTSLAPVKKSYPAIKKPILLSYGNTSKIDEGQNLGLK